MSTIFTDSYLQGLIDQAEVDLSLETRVLFYRFSLSTVAGTSTYSLPKNLIGIHQISYLGMVLEPKEFSDFGYTPWYKPNNLGVQGKPMYYARVGYGWDKVFLYPIPSATIAADDTHLNDDLSINLVIVTGIVAVDLDNYETTPRMPVYLLRNIIKYRAMSKAYAKDGIGQNLVAAQYYDKKYTEFLALYKSIIDTIPAAVQIRFGEDDINGIYRKRLPRPVLPSSGKWSI